MSTTSGRAFALGIGVGMLAAAVALVIVVGTMAVLVYGGVL